MMKKILTRTAFIPQGETQCQTASFALACSLLLKNKYGIDFSIDPKNIEELDENLSFTPSKFLEEHRKIFPKSIQMGKIFSPKKQPLGFFRKKIIRNRPIICQIDNWAVVDGKLHEGTGNGHFVVCYGVDEKMELLFENPWGSEYAFSADWETFSKLSGMCYTLF